MPKKLTRTDGLGPYEIKRIRSAVRQVWQRSLARKLCVIRCTGSDGYAYCEECGNRTPKLKVDHVVNVGALDDGYIPRMFVPSSGLRGCCDACHKIKTKAERKSKKGIK